MALRRILLFASTREAMIHIFHEDSLDKFSEVENVKTEFGLGQWVLMSTRTTSFLWTANFGPAAAPTVDHPIRSWRLFRGHSACWFMAADERNLWFDDLPGRALCSD